MSYSYTGYQLRQADYHPWQQPVSQPLLHPIRALDQQPSYPYPQDGRLHPQHHPYQARKPTSWDPPWLRQETAYRQPSSYEPDLYSLPPPSCWDPPRLCTQQGYSQPYQPPQQPHHTALRQPTSWDPPAYWETPGQRPFHEVSAYDHPLPPNHNSGWNQPTPQLPCPATTTTHPTLAQLQQILEACYKMESHLVAADRRIDNMLPPELPQPAQPYDSQVFGFGDLVQHLPPSGNSKPSPGPSGLVPYDLLAPPQQSSTTPPPFALLPDTALDHPSPPSTLIPDCDRVEKGFADSAKKIPVSSVGFGGLEKVEKIEKSSPDSARVEKPVHGCIEIQCARQLNASQFKIPQVQIGLGSSIVDNASLKLLSDLSHVRVVASMNHRSTSLDADARLIPPQNDTLCLSIHGRIDVGRRSTIRCMFDPGGFLDTHRCFMVPTLRTRWISTVGELIRLLLL